MALTLGDNFSYQGAKPLDARLTYSTLAAMKAVADATMYEGCLAYCTATGKTYQWKSTNTVDETLGKWREFESGGSGGTSDYNDLENLPKINNVEVKGSLTSEDLGINIPTKTSELTNDSDFITDDDLPETDGALDLSKFKAPGTAGQVEGHIYSTDETIVGKWIDGKPLYEKTFWKNVGITTGLNTLAHNISNLGKITKIEGMGKREDGYFMPIPTGSIQTENIPWSVMLNGGDNTAIQFSIGKNYVSPYSFTEIYITMQYTKTTD